MPHLILIPFLFALGACIGSFLNVVVWRLPRGLSIVSPPSHCPRCKQPLKWYDNIPVVGWIHLRGKCRFCAQPISPRYPIVEAVTGLLFVFYYVMFFMAQIGPCPQQPVMVPHETLGTLMMVPRPLTLAGDWPIYFLYMALISGLLAATLIDLELFMIPIEIPLSLAAVGISIHAIIDRPTVPGALNTTPVAGSLAAAGAVGLIISVVLLRRGIIPLSFPDGEPMQDVEPEEAKEPQAADAVAKQIRKGLLLAVPCIVVAAVGLFLIESAPAAAGWTIAMVIAVGFWLILKFPMGSVDLAASPQDAATPAKQWTRRDLSQEMRNEMLFLLPPMLLAITAWIVVMKVAPVGRWWSGVMTHHWLSGVLGAILGALVGGLVVWITRILGTLAFGRLAMGLGDVHLMFGAGAIIGAAGATVAFFLAPFFGIAVALYMLFTGTKRELPYGPYLSMATAFILLFSCPIMAWLRPGVMGLSLVLQQLFGGG